MPCTRTILKVNRNPPRSVQTVLVLSLYRFESTSRSKTKYSLVGACFWCGLTVLKVCRLVPFKRQNDLQVHAGMAAATPLEPHGTGMQATTNHARFVGHESGRAEVEDHLVANLHPTLRSEVHSACAY